MAGASTNLTAAARMVQQLKIDDYSATKFMCGTICKKSRWSVGGYEWEIHLYPSTWKFGTGYGYDEPLFRKTPRSKTFKGNWSWENQTTWVALKLVFLDETPPSDSIKACFGCRLVDQRGVLQPSQEKSVTNEFRRSQDSSAAVVLIESDDVPESGYLTGDSLAVECSITVLNVKELPAPTSPAKEVIALPPPTNLHQHFGELLQSGTGADVKFIVSGESFPAHKCILSARSPVFMAEFYGQMKEKCWQRVEVKDMEPPVFKALLHFIYTDIVPELDQELELVATMAQHLLVAADRYGLERLKLICEIKLAGGITVDTAATTLALAEQHNCLQLKAKCVEFIVSTPAAVDAVLATKGFKHLAVSCPLVLADLLKSAHGRKS